ncbi:hypothetical protein B0A50_06153 [Salinomyces thailandicus]|uniref:Lysophospholipase n=1 Tax=Salinomyces thailandicus TaxID=706561 RepID=A0A4U0TSF6_9PEZI|nr:hypothetical protein B0A50_06153 [Salinomyces thailandica]
MGSGVARTICLFLLSALCALVASAPALDPDIDSYATPANQSARLNERGILDSWLMDTLDMEGGIDLGWFAGRYAPKHVGCPDGVDLVRPAAGIGAEEAKWVDQRKLEADKALATWLKGQGDFSTDDLPLLAMTSSGGGLRAFTQTAGVVQAFDSRDSQTNVSGIYQSLTYHSALSGGAWFLPAHATYGWSKVSDLVGGHAGWASSFSQGLLTPPQVFAPENVDELGYIAAELMKKQVSGYDTTLVDAYGRILGYSLFDGNNGGVGNRLSALTDISAFEDHKVPLPILTALGARAFEAHCGPDVNAVQYEFNPFEWGSWDEGVAAFASTKYMGTRFSQGKPTLGRVKLLEEVVSNATALANVSGDEADELADKGDDDEECVTQYDNLGYIIGTSGDVFTKICDVLPSNDTTDENDLLGASHHLQKLVNITKDPFLMDLYGTFPNPFYNYSHSSAVAAHPKLTLADGGINGQNNPIWPLIQPERNVSVLIVQDNSITGDMEVMGYPDGSALRQTYNMSQSVGLTKMPFIPEAAEFKKKQLNQNATFFGCPASYAPTKPAATSANSSSAALGTNGTAIHTAFIGNTTSAANVTSTTSNRNSTSPGVATNGDTRSPKRDNPNDTILIIWLPNKEYNTQSNWPTLLIKYDEVQTKAMIKNGNRIATQDDDEQWSFCLACAIGSKSSVDVEMPGGCEACFWRYCYFADA